MNNFKFINWLYRAHLIISMADRNDNSVTLTFPDIGSLATHNKMDYLLF